ncbi:MAG: transcription-repair coupling factor [Methylococcales bacterium]|nr:transcription-repair coupling factor [Methylococcales bacterium]
MLNQNYSIFSPKIPHKPKLPVVWSGLKGCSDALALASAIKNENRLFIIITVDTQTALRLEHELAFFLDDEYPILKFPDWETLPYDVFSPLPEIISERLKTLALLSQTKRGAVVISLATLMHRLAPREHVLAHSFVLAVGGTFNLELNRRKLESVGYQCVSQVYQHAEFAVRGSIVDLFPMGSSKPYRIELFDDEIESIRTFDVETQMSLEKVARIELFPAREFPLTDESIKLFRQQFRQKFPKTSASNSLYVDVSKGIMPSGIEYYLPLFVNHTESLFDYLPESSVLVLPAEFEAIATHFYDEAQVRFEQRKYDLERPILNPEHLFLETAIFLERINVFKRIILSNELENEGISFSGDNLPDLMIDGRLKQPAERLQNFIKNFDGKTLLIAETAGHREALIEKLTHYRFRFKQVKNWAQFLESEHPVSLLVAPLYLGLYLQNPAIAIIPENKLSGEKIQQRKRRKSAVKELENMVNNLNELTLSDPVVHREHGVGRYLGLQILTVGGVKAEFLSLEYAKGDKIYVPVTSLNLIGRYTGMGAETAPLHKLGADQWTKAKQKAIARVRDVAAELLDIHAQRALKSGHAFKIDADEYLSFSEAFPFEETPDQQTAIETILEDMQNAQPMDRVVCGDVGFGKTEVAMRAAFIAVQSGKQVAVLVPTTLLAQQHFQNFRDRFADWPIRVEVASRFVTAKQQKKVKDELAIGTVDIIIGTHKLLLKTIKYKQLGLVIIDEEHRFGVRQKEHFKKLRSELDLLTLTATPIPRTLNMAMSGLRNISIIATPPPNRHPIKTFISEWVDAQIKEACQREIKRGGQVFFLHNNVKTMEKMALTLEALIPEARIEIAHGQMPERKLERIMLDFYHQRFNLLLSTTIIESGIDLPTANTIIINRADKLGLAQLHQLRGRVGRSHHRAYAYFVVPSKSLMTKDAIKRLEAVEASGDLGAGFMLSSHDLEIRGAGELLGDGQSGQIQEVGFSLYTELLEKAVSALKSGHQPELELSLDTGVEVNLHVPALIPDDYLPDIHARLVLYKRIASMETHAELQALKIEIIDRFGLFSEAVKALFFVSEIKQRAKALNLKKIEFNSDGGRFVFSKKTTINSEQLIILVQTQATCYQLKGMEQLKIMKKLTDLEEKVLFIKQLLKQLSPIRDEVSKT